MYHITSDLKDVSNSSDRSVMYFQPLIAPDMSKLLHFYALNSTGQHMFMHNTVPINNYYTTCFIKEFIPSRYLFIVIAT